MSKMIQRMKNSWWIWGTPIAVILVAGLVVLPGLGKAEADLSALNGPITTVKGGPLTISVSESGTIEPREQIILKNELEDPAAIVFVVPEGTRVEKGDIVCELDVTQVENDVVERRIRVQNDEAALVAANENLAVVKNQAQADVEQAVLTLKFAAQDLKKYKEGEYPQLLNQAEAKITLAEEELTQANEDLKWSKILYDEKYLSQSELQQDELAAKQAELNLKLAKDELELLENYTYQRQIDQLESDVHQAELALERAKRSAKANIAQAEATLSSNQAQLKEEKGRLEELESQLEKAKIQAPIDGLVLYATSVGHRWRRNDEPVAVGTMIDEQDEIIYLPTASEFNVKVQVSEVDLNKIKKGQEVKVRVDALPGRMFTGEVASISAVPDADSRWMNPNLKLYDVVVHLDPNEAELRSGMSCKAEIVVEEYKNVVYVPLQSVVQRDLQDSVYLVEDDGTVSPSPVKIGLDNSRFVHIQEGLQQGQKVLLAPPFQSEEEESPSSLAEEDAEEEQPAPGQSPPPRRDRGGPPGQSRSSNT